MALAADISRHATAPVRRMRGAGFWRGLQRALPLGQRFHALIAAFVEPEGLIAVPWDRHRLTLDAGWLRVPSTAAAPVYRAPRRQNPEFFALVAPMLAASGPGAIVDVGANIGVYTLNFRERSAAPIVAFEPDPASFDLLSRNVSNNALPSVTIRRAACGDAPGRQRFCGGINGAMVVAGEGDAEVAVVRLDDALDGRRIALIKIDCEGYEWQVLSGARALIETQQPLLFVELHPKLIGRYGHSLAEVCDLLRPHYDLEFWDAGAAQRSRRRLMRFLGRYRDGLRRLAGERDMLACARADPAPDQIFLCARPRRVAS